MFMKFSHAEFMFFFLIKFTITGGQLIAVNETSDGNTPHSNRLSLYMTPFLSTTSTSTTSTSLTLKSEAGK